MRHFNESTYIITLLDELGESCDILLSDVASGEMQKDLKTVKNAYKKLLSDCRSHEAEKKELLNFIETVGLSDDLYLYTSGKLSLYRTSEIKKAMEGVKK